MFSLRIIYPFYCIFDIIFTLSVNSFEHCDNSYSTSVMRFRQLHLFEISYNVEFNLNNTVEFKCLNVEFNLMS